MKSTARHHHNGDSHLRAHTTKYSDPLDIYEIFPSGSQFCIWINGASHQFYIEIGENKGAGVHPTSGKNYTFIECKLINPKLPDMSPVVHKIGEVVYLVAFDDIGMDTSSKRRKFHFTQLLNADGGTPGWSEVSMITELNNNANRQHAQAVHNILGHSHKGHH